MVYVSLVERVFIYIWTKNRQLSSMLVILLIQTFTSSFINMTLYVKKLMVFKISYFSFTFYLSKKRRNLEFHFILIELFFVIYQCLCCAAKSEYRGTFNPPRYEPLLSHRIYEECYLNLLMLYFLVQTTTSRSEITIIMHIVLLDNIQKVKTDLFCNEPLWNVVSFLLVYCFHIDNWFNNFIL